MPTASLLDAGLPGLLPLLPLTRDGKSREAVEAMISSLYPLEDASRRGLLSLGYALAALVFQEREEHDWLKRRFLMIEDILAESWAFQELQEKALIKGREEGMQQGLEQGMQQGMQQVLLAFVQARYPALIGLAEERCKTFDNPEQLQALIINVGLAQSEQEAKKLLSAPGELSS